MIYQIKNRFTGAILFEHEADSLREAVEMAVKSGASLAGARLDGASLAGASLDGASLDGASLDGANLAGARLDGARLAGASLAGARLDGARLDKTILDPTNKPNADVVGFESIPNQTGWVYGYRTRATSAAGLSLQDDRIYGTEVFSTCTTECHPGWYLWPTINASREFREPAGDHIKVKARVIDIHHAGSKWRSRAIWTIESVEAKL